MKRYIVMAATLVIIWLVSSCNVIDGSDISASNQYNDIASNVSLVVLGQEDLGMDTLDDGTTDNPGDNLADSHADSPVDISDNDSNNEEAINSYPLSGNHARTWRKAPNSDKGFSKVYKFYEDGGFICMERGNVYTYGNWLLENDMLIFDITWSNMGIVPLRQALTFERTMQHGATGILLDSELYLDIDEQALYYQAVKGQGGNAEDFTGYWRRTREIWENGAILEITEQDGAEFHYEIFAMWLAQHFGSRDGLACIVANNQAFVYIEPLSSRRNCGWLLLFTLIEGELIVEFDGGIFGEGLGFGANVTANGFYTRGEPEYANMPIGSEFPTIEDFRAGEAH